MTRRLPITSATRRKGRSNYTMSPLKGTGSNTWDRFAPGNPSIQKVDGKYVLVYIRNPIGMTKGMGAHPGTQRIGMALADSLDGPWKKIGTDGKVLDPSPDPKHWTHGAGVVNPAFLKHPDGRYLLYFQGQGREKWAWRLRPSWKGHTCLKPTPFTKNDKTIEDGYAYATGGKFYFLTTDNHGIGIRGGGLLWESADGITFDPIPTMGFKTPRFYLPKADPKAGQEILRGRDISTPASAHARRKTRLSVHRIGLRHQRRRCTVCYLLRCKSEK